MTWPKLYRPLAACLILLTSILIQPAPVRACPCGPMDSPSAEFIEVDAVFVGVVTNIVSASARSNYHRLTRVYNKLVPPLPYIPALQSLNQIITFQVRDSWKGVTSTRLSVFTFGGGDCGYRFVEGKRYLVYSHRREDGSFWVTSCSRTIATEALRAAEDPAYLQPIPTLELSPAFPLRPVISAILVVVTLIIVWRVVVGIHRKESVAEVPGP